MGLIEPEQLRDILLWVNRCLRANKAFERRWPVRVAVIDGHEFFSQ